MSDAAIGQSVPGKDCTGSDSDRDHSDCGVTGESSTNGDTLYLVVYMTDAFLYGQQTALSDGDENNASRLAMIGLLQCYITMLKAVPEHLHSCIQLQVGTCLHLKLTSVVRNYLVHVGQWTTQ